MSFYHQIKKSIRYWLLRRLPTCRDTVSIISQSMERPLTLRERFLITLHLWVCSWCQWYMEHLKTIRKTLRQREPSEADFANSPGLSAEARERLKRKLSDIR